MISDTSHHLTPPARRATIPSHIGYVPSFIRSGPLIWATYHHLQFGPRCEGKGGTWGRFSRATRSTFHQSGGGLGYAPPFVAEVSDCIGHVPPLPFRSQLRPIICGRHQHAPHKWWDVARMESGMVGRVRRPSRRKNFFPEPSKIRPTIFLHVVDVPPFPNGGTYLG